LTFAWRDPILGLMKTRNSARFSTKEAKTMGNEANVQSQQIKEVWEKVVTDQVARLESFYREVGKLQSGAIAQIATGVDDAARFTKETVTYGQQLSEQWRKLALDATRKVAEWLAPARA
jgi:hypothetical protein